MAYPQFESRARWSIEACQVRNRTGGWSNPVERVPCGVMGCGMVDGMLTRIGRSRRVAVAWR